MTASELADESEEAGTCADCGHPGPRGWLDGEFGCVSCRASALLADAWDGVERSKPRETASMVAAKGAIQVLDAFDLKLRRLPFGYKGGRPVVERDNVRKLVEKMQADLRAFLDRETRAANAGKG